MIYVKVKTAICLDGDAWDDAVKLYKTLNGENYTTKLKY
jgi:hypothetical protein